MAFQQTMQYDCPNRAVISRHAPELTRERFGASRIVAARGRRRIRPRQDRHRAKYTAVHQGAAILPYFVVAGQMLSYHRLTGISRPIVP